MLSTSLQEKTTDQQRYWLRRRNVEITGKGKKKVETPKPLRGQGEPFSPIGQTLWDTGFPCNLGIKEFKRNAKATKRQELNYKAVMWRKVENKRKQAAQTK